MASARARDKFIKFIDTESPDRGPAMNIYLSLFVLTHTSRLFGPACKLITRIPTLFAPRQRLLPQTQWPIPTSNIELPRSRAGNFWLRGPDEAPLRLCVFFTLVLFSCIPARAYHNVSCVENVRQICATCTRLINAFADEWQKQTNRRKHEQNKAHKRPGIAISLCLSRSFFHRGKESVINVKLKNNETKGNQRVTLLGRVVLQFRRSKMRCEIGEEETRHKKYLRTGRETATGKRDGAKKERERKDLWQALSSNEIARCSFLRGGGWEPTWTLCARRRAGARQYTLRTNSHVAQLPLPAVPRYRTPRF